MINQKIDIAVKVYWKFKQRIKNPNTDSSEKKNPPIKGNPSAKSCKKLRSEKRHNKNKNRGG